ncbi:unnamed protein product [Ixodes persulcatus]
MAIEKCSSYVGSLILLSLQRWRWLSGRSLGFRVFRSRDEPSEGGGQADESLSSRPCGTRTHSAGAVARQAHS